MSSPLRAAWLQQYEGCNTIADAVERGLEKWASAPTGISSGEREAWLAGFSANVLVEQALSKLASTLTPEEYAFMQDLHAEASLRDLQWLTKTALAPAAWGAISGGVIGAGLGALKDDENRLRGAAIGAIPGAAIGALTGHGWGTWRQGIRDANAAATREASTYAKQEALRAAQQTLTDEKILAQRETAHRAEEALKAKKQTDDAKKIMDQQAAERWHRSAASATEDLLQEYAANAAQDPSYAPLAEQANTLLQHLHENKDHIIAARAARPGDPVVLANAVPGYHGQVVQEIQNRAQRLFKSLA